MSNINNRVFGQNVDPKIIKQFDRLQRGRFNTNPNHKKIADSGQANNGSFNAYTPGSSAGFTYSVQKHDTPVYMTYRDHVREGQTQFASGVMWDEMQAYGFYRYTDPNSLSNPEPASR